MRQPKRPDLFPTAPRSARIKRMHVMDCGSGCITFECMGCGYKTGWIEWGGTISEAKRGLPCPKCNAIDREQKS